ncbi:MFS transporter [Microterricola viridarii]|uniref:Major facilitator superfamily (MFS) profile domain-containing protein n=1 Tax=Microterricola viridarii TaxID=412690 RepID=A0A109QXC7_9MICO|nr:MFS transporter [Microterricola viridarii]AMB59717.1 hypothetical protein AWU67_13550 [Microterricola viridarii]
MSSTSETTTQADATAGTRPPTRQLLSGVVGMMLEMYDWQVFGFMAVYVAGQLFDPADPFAGLLNALLVFAVGFVMRPIGGALIGAYSDKFGRKSGMILGMYLLGAGSLVIALIPSYAQIGAAAGFILVAARIIQGLGVGGEQGAAVSFLSEIAPPGKRAMYNALGYIASSVAVLFAVLLAAVLPMLIGQEAMATWGWRIPFLLGALFTVFAVVMRRTMTETQLFTEAKQVNTERRSALTVLLTRYWKQSLITMLLISGSTFAYYVFVLQYATYANIVTGIQLSQAQMLTALVIVVFAALQPLFAWVSDRVGRRRVLLFSVLGVLVTSWPALFWVSADPAVVIGLQMLVVIPAAAGASVSNAALAELFPTEVRAVGVAFPYAIAVALFGGTAPYVMTWLGGQGLILPLALYGSVLCVFSLIAVLLMPDRAKEALHTEAISTSAGAGAAASY